MPRSLLRAACALALCLLWACTHWPQEAPATATSLDASAAAEDDEHAAKLYAEAEDALQQGEQALAAWRQGEVDGTATQLAQSRARLIATARRCAAVPGCAIERVLRAQDALLDQQAQALFGSDSAPAHDHSGEILPVVAQGSPVLAAMPESGISVNLLKGRQLRDLIEVNEPLRAALREWLTWMRPQLLDAYENYQYMRYKMWPAYAEAGLPEALLFGILAKESGGKVHAVSSAGASGPLQFMPATGRRYGLGLQGDFDTRFDATASTQANVAYLNDQFGRLNNDLELVLGAYNGGEGRMSRLSPQGSRRFWDPRVFKQVSPETRAYVPMVLAAAWLFLHPDEYGLRFPHVDDRPGAIDLAVAMSLNELSICLGQDGNDRGWFRTLRNLNPRWDPNVRLPVGTHLEVPVSAAAAYERHCTSAQALVQLQALQDASIPGVVNVTPLGSSVRTHTVSKGETLSTIARRHGCSDVKGIATANSIAAPRYAIREGQKLRLPACRA